jgi:hypothetical protein
MHCGNESDSNLSKEFAPLTTMIVRCIKLGADSCQLQMQAQREAETPRRLKSNKRIENA